MHNKRWTNWGGSVKILSRCGVKTIGGIQLANIKSAIKRNKQNDKRRIRNRVFRGTARTFVTKARAALTSGDAEAAEAATLQAIRTLDQAAEKGIIHKNNAARRKSRLMKRLAELKK